MQLAPSEIFIVVVLSSMNSCASVWLAAAACNRARVLNNEPWYDCRDANLRVGELGVVP